MEAVDFGTSVSCCSLGSDGSMGCSVLMLYLHRVLDVPPMLGTALSLSPWPALLLTLLWAGPQILLGLLEQTSHSCCLWQLSCAQLYSPIPCSACPPLGPGFWVWFVSVWCSGEGSGSGELWGHSPGETVVGFRDHLGKLPGMIKEIVWTQARER